VFANKVKTSWSLNWACRQLTERGATQSETSTLCEYSTETSVGVTKDSVGVEMERDVAEGSNGAEICTDEVDADITRGWT
jgi:hypothetical protein